MLISRTFLSKTLARSHLVSSIGIFNRNRDTIELLISYSSSKLSFNNNNNNNWSLEYRDVILFNKILREIIKGGGGF